MAELASFHSHHTINRWLRFVAMPGQTFTNTPTSYVDNVYFRFPYSIDEPALANEDILYNDPAVESYMRFKFRHLRQDSHRLQSQGGQLPDLQVHVPPDARSIMTNSASDWNWRRTFSLNTQKKNNTPTWTTDTSPAGDFLTTTDLSNNHDVFTFGVMSPTTLVISSIRLNVGIHGKLVENFSQSSTMIMGWMHNPIYADPLPAEIYKYASAYSIGISHSGQATLTMHQRVGHCGGNIGLGGEYKTELPTKYYDIVLQEGEYVPGLFLTDLLLIDSNFVKRGKVDNRVAVMGRGNFVLGQLYQTEDAFGRVGLEDWLCVSSLTQNGYQPGAWYSGESETLEKFKVWKENEYDYLLIRVYTEEDAPTDITNPTLVSITTGAASTVIQNTTVVYTVTFSEDIDMTTVTSADFENAGTSTITIGSINEPTAGVFTVPVTPTSAGTLQLQIKAGSDIRDVVGNTLNTTNPLTGGVGVITVSAG